MTGNCKETSATAFALAIKIQARFRGIKGRRRSVDRATALIDAMMAGEPPPPLETPPSSPKTKTPKKKQWPPLPAPPSNDEVALSSIRAVNDKPSKNEIAKPKNIWSRPTPPPSKEESPTTNGEHSIEAPKAKVEPKEDAKVVPKYATNKTKKVWPPPESSRDGVPKGTTSSVRNAYKALADAKKMAMKKKEMETKTNGSIKEDPKKVMNDKTIETKPNSSVGKTFKALANAKIVINDKAIETKKAIGSMAKTFKDPAKEEPKKEATAVTTEINSNSSMMEKAKAISSVPTKENAETETKGGATTKPVRAAKPPISTKLAIKSKPPRPVTKAKNAPVIAGGTRVWVKESAVNAVRNPKPAWGKNRSLTRKPSSGYGSSDDDSMTGGTKPSFNRRKLANKSSSVSQTSDDGSEMGAAVVTRATKYAWKPGKLVESSRENVTVSLDEDSHESSSGPLVLPAKTLSDGDVVMANEFEISKETGKPICPEDLISLTHLHEPAVVECLEQRYEDNHIYTSTGPILLALNPFKRISGLYEDATMHKYWGKAEMDPEDSNLPPHIYAIADNAFVEMMIQLEACLGDDIQVSCDQSILVSGESGAGKTVTTKFAMKYLAALSRRAAMLKEESKEAEEPQNEAPKGRMTLQRMSSRMNVTSQHNNQNSVHSVSSATEHESIESQVLQSNPILESFGNARTIRNDNSSRFGKFIEMQFTRKGRLVGASVEVYLLEKVRLVKAAVGERNYHVFYELLDGEMNQRTRDNFFIDHFATAEDFKLTATGTYTRRDGVQDEETYDDLRIAMNSMEFAKEEQHDIFTIVAAMLHVSNLTFLDVDHKSKLDDKNSHLKPACNLLGVTPEDLSRALCHVSLSVGGSTVQKNLTVEKAIKGVEALIKVTYGTLFNYLVSRVNKKVAYQKKINEKDGTTIHNPQNDPAATIGVLDIFGFESFKFNSFEQLCINYCNESLQQQFNSFVLVNEQAEYEREGIDWSFIEFPENQDVLDLIGKKGIGLLGVLDDQCKTPGTTDKSFALALYNQFKTHIRFSADRKQQAILKFSINHYAGAVEYSTDDFIEKNRDELPKEAAELLQNSSNKFIQLLAGIIESSKEKPSNTNTRNKANKTKPTVGGEFRLQLRRLREKIDKMTPHYVRCLKPNDQLVQDHYDRAAIVEQLRCCGIIEACRVARAGFSNRYTHTDFVRRYRSCVWKQLKIRKVRPRRRGPRGADLKKQPRQRPPITPKECSDLLKLLAKKIQQKDKEENSDDEDNDDNKKEKDENRVKNLFENKSNTENLSKILTEVGMQFGTTKVFVRHTAFEKLERIRAQEQSTAAMKLNSIFRMVLARVKYNSDLRNVAHEERIRILNAENPEWTDKLFGKETYERFEKFKQSFSAKPAEDFKPKKAARPTDWVVDNGQWKKIYLDE